MCDMTHLYVQHDSFKERSAEMSDPRTRFAEMRDPRTRSRVLVRRCFVAEWIVSISRDYWIYFDITWKRSKNSEFWEKVPRIGTCLSGKFSPATGVSFAVDFLWFPETRSQAQWNDIRFVWTIDMFFLYWDPRTCLFFPKKIDYTTTSSNNYGQAVM